MEKTFERFPPKPQRDHSHFTLLKAIAVGCPKEIGIGVAMKSLVTCRACFGFAHGIKKCPT